MQDARTLIHRILQRKPTADQPKPIEALLASGDLETVYQPVSNLVTGAIDGYEALVRNRKESESGGVQALLDASETQELQTEFELACAYNALRGWGYPHVQGRIYLNISAQTLTALSGPKEFRRLEVLFLRSQVPCNRVVIEITRHRKIGDLAALERTTEALHALGCTIALDDVKASQRSLDLWFHLKPGIIKLDKRMTTDLQTDPTTAKILRTLVSMGFKTGASLVVKAVEDAEDLRIVRDAGVQFAQGHFLGFPSPVVAASLNVRARTVLEEKWTRSDGQSRPGELVGADSGLQGLRSGPQWWD